MLNPRMLGSIALAVTTVLFASCNSEGKDGAETESAVKTIENVDQLNAVLESSEDRLLLFDLYADWCRPCKILSPMLEEIAQEQKAAADVYKINVDKNPQIASAFGVRGIPYVVFVHEQKAVHAMTGVHPKDDYIRAIDLLTSDSASSSPATSELEANGNIVEGTRVIQLNPTMEIGDLYVYRGETVKLVVKNPSYAYSLHVPEFGISEQGQSGKDVEVRFKAEKIGVFPVFCNGNCPEGDGAQVGRVVVMQYEGNDDIMLNELTVEQASAMIEKENALVLDVRTPAEYYRSHIQGATLVPLQQLQQRVSELQNHKDKPVLIYCRTGNRSTVAAQILVEEGFSKLYHLSQGIVGWQRAGKPVTEAEARPVKTPAR